MLQMIKFSVQRLIEVVRLVVQPADTKIELCFARLCPYKKFKFSTDMNIRHSLSQGYSFLDRTPNFKTYQKTVNTEPAR